MDETAHLLSTPANTALLMESIAQNKAGQLTHLQQMLEHIEYNRKLTETRAFESAKFYEALKEEILVEIEKINNL